MSVGVWGSPSSSEGGDWSFEGALATALTYALMSISEGAIAQMAMALSHNTVALMAQWVAHCMSSVEQNRATNSITK